jgi:type I restriction enzyme M protein
LVHRRILQQYIKEISVTSEEIKQLENDLWRSADTLRANSDLKASEYSTPVLGLIFLKFADNRYRRFEKDIFKQFTKEKGTRLEKPLSEIAIEKCGFYLPDHARYDHLLNLPEQEDIARAIKRAMEAIEEYKPELRGVLPQDEYFRLTRTDRSIPAQLLKNFSNIPRDAEGDIFGQIYEYFLGNFAMAEGQGGGEFFTPRSVVRLMVEIIEPFGGRVFDPACGSAGMFVQSAKFIDRHRDELVSGDGDIYVYGQEKTLETVKLAKMNLAVNGLRGEVKQANTYYENPHDSFGRFDYVLTNPPFNVDDVSLGTVEKDRRFNTYGIPRNKTKVKKGEQAKETVPNANYLWINLFATSLSDHGRAALVMANSASDARHSEADIRRTLIEKNLISGMLTLPSNMFYTVTLPATLWFFDKAKKDDRILFIDARNIFTQIDRAHREFSPEQIDDIAIISHLRRGKRDKFVRLIDDYFARGMAKLGENRQLVGPVTEQLLAVLDNGGGKQAVDQLLAQWADLTRLSSLYADYLGGAANETAIDTKNAAQHQLRQAFDPFFLGLHGGLKQLGKIIRHHEKAQAETARQAKKRLTVDRKVKALKTALEKLQAAVGNAERFFQHIHWLQERFPLAEYEDVTGLCKLATPEEVREQDYSLNPGRYVGVVIEEDGKTEEEFLEELLTMNKELELLNAEARQLECIIDYNINVMTGDM